MCLGIPGQVVEVRDELGVAFAKVRFAGIVRDVCLACQPDVVAGDYVLVHVGFAIAKIDEAEAARAYRVLKDIGQLADLTADQPAEGAPS